MMTIIILIALGAIVAANFGSFFYEEEVVQATQAVADDDNGDWSIEDFLLPILIIIATSVALVYYQRARRLAEEEAEEARKQRVKEYLEASARSRALGDAIEKSMLEQRQRREMEKKSADLNASAFCNGAPCSAASEAAARRRDRLREELNTYVRRNNKAPEDMSRYDGIW